MYLKSLFPIFTIILLTIGCGGGSTDSSSSSDSDTDSDTDGTTETVTLSGTVTVSESDLAPSHPAGLSKAAALMQKQARVALASATVTLVKIESDGTETEIATTTADSDGNYSLSAIPAAVAGTGAATDFYYEVRGTDGNLTVIAPVAPEADETVDVSPETHLAAKMLTDVQSVDDDVIPRPEVIENLRELTFDEVVNDLAESVALPSLDDDDTFVAAATAIASNNGNSEKALRTFEAEKEMLALDSAGTSADADDVGSYLERVSRQACNFNEQFNLPESARDAMADAFISDGTVTPEEIVSAYNDNNGNDSDATTAGAVSEFDAVLETLDTAFSEKNAISSEDMIGLFTKRDLAPDTFDSSTELKVDQSISFVQELFPTPCQTGAFDMIGFVSDLTGTDIASTPDIVDIQLFHDSGFGCSSQSATKGHLRAEVQVYAAGGATVNGVTITRGDNSRSKSLTQQHSNGPFSRWTLSTSETDTNSDSNFFCMTLPSEITYTITVDLNGASDLTEQVTRTHVDVPEAALFMVDADGTETPWGSDTTITVSDVKRPFFKWDPEPGTPDSSVIANAPAGSKIKFTFEISYNSSSQQTYNLALCGSGGSGAKLMDRNYFIADMDCDTATCAATSGAPESSLACRTNIQTFLVDGNDRFLGQAAGNFRSYCYDSNGDGDCGE